MKANEILDEAKDLILDRGADYGTPAINHLRIARLWSTYLDHHIEPNEVAICMALVKIARIQESPHHADSFKDGKREGYTRGRNISRQAFWQE